MMRPTMQLATAMMALAAAAPMAALRAAAPTGQAALARFLARGEEPPVEYRALRHLEANNPLFRQSAWMDAWTDFTRADGLTVQIVGEGGSTYIRRKVLRAALDGEQKMWAAKEPQRASLTLENYQFEDGGLEEAGLAALAIKPRRKDVLLVEGSIFVQPHDGELTRIEGRLSKTPSFWTRRVEIVRHYRRIGGVRVPVSIESVANVLVAGRSTFKMTYQYETINGQHVGNPQPPVPPTAAGR